MEAREKLVELLQRTRNYVSRSLDSCYAGLSPAQIASDLSIAVEQLVDGGPIDRELLQMHFSPTGTIQETAIDCGWGDDFLDLSKRFDALIDAVN